MKRNGQEKTDWLFIMIKHCSKVLVLSLVACCATLFFSGCKTVANPFIRTEANYSALPVDAMTDVAYYLEFQVREGNRTPELEARSGLTIDTPEVAQALRSRAARSHLIKELLDSGHSAEQSNGKIAIIRSAAYKQAGTKFDRDRNALIVISENRDRVILYDSLRKANGLASAARTAVEEIFFTARKSALEPGQKYRIDGGEIQVH